MSVSTETDEQLNVIKFKETESSSRTSLTSNVNFSHTLLESGEKVLLQTAMVIVCENTGFVASIRLLLDSANQRTFIIDQLARTLNL